MLCAVVGVTLRNKKFMKKMVLVQMKHLKLIMNMDFPLENEYIKNRKNGKVYKWINEKMKGKF